MERLSHAAPGWLGAFCAMGLSVTIACAADAPAAGYQPDWVKLSKHIVHDSLKLAPGERVIIHYLPGHNPGFVTALRDEIVTSGGVISAELTWPSGAMGKYLDGLTPAEKAKRVEAEDFVYRELFTHSDVYLWLDASQVEDLTPRRFEHLIGESKVRAIHCHWFEPPDPKEHDTAWRMYERAINIDPAKIDAVLAPLESGLRDSTVHLTSPAGTDLRFRIPAAAWLP